MTRTKHPASRLERLKIKRRKDEERYKTREEVAPRSLRQIRRRGETEDALHATVDQYVREADVYRDPEVIDRGILEEGNFHSR